MMRASSFQNRLVISTDVGSVVGKVRRIVMDLDQGRVGGLVVEPLQGGPAVAIPGDELLSVGEDAIMVYTSPDRIAPEAQEAVRAMMQRETQAYRTGIFTERGRKVGYFVEPYLAGQGDMSLVGFELFSDVLFSDRVRGVLLYGDHVVVGQDLIMVPEDLTGFLLDEEAGLEMREDILRRRETAAPVVARRPERAAPASAPVPAPAPSPAPSSAPAPAPLAALEPEPPAPEPPAPEPPAPEPPAPEPPAPEPPAPEPPAPEPPAPDPAPPEAATAEEAIFDALAPGSQPAPAAAEVEPSPDAAAASPIDRLQGLDSLEVRTVTHDSAVPESDAPGPPAPAAEPEGGGHLPGDLAPGAGVSPPPPPPSASGGGDGGDDRLVRFVLGKVASRDLATPDGRSVVKKGDTIDEAAVELARQHEMMTMLFLAASQTGGRFR